LNERRATKIAADLGLNRQPGKCSVCGVHRCSPSPEKQVAFRLPNIEDSVIC
jgi:hypothetical protein